MIDTKLNRQIARCVLLAALTLFVGRLHAQTITQTVVLQPGQNFFYLEVLPSDTNVSHVFSHPAVRTVWAPRVRVTTAAFLESTNTPPFNTAGWMVYSPTNYPESINNDLYAVAVNTPYLVNLQGTNQVTLSIVGRPSIQSLAFAPASYSLRGFPIDPSNPPTFRNFFQSSSAQFVNNALQPMYRFNTLNGQWQLVGPNESMTRDATYWIYSLAASSYMGPLAAGCSSGDGLDFLDTIQRMTLSLTNNTSSQMNVTISHTVSPFNPISYDAATSPSNAAIVMISMPTTLVTNIPANGVTAIKLYVRRSLFPGGSYSNILDVNNGQGTLLHVPLSALAPTSLQAGLWAGDVTVNAVAETYNNLTNTTPVTAPFSMRALLHVTPTGNTRFLREAIEMLQPAVTNVSGGVTTVTPATPVLITDKSILAQFTGVTVRDNVAVGRRISTAGYDFDPPGGTNFLPMTGSFGTNNTVGVTITIRPSTPTNPFLHRYNPEHDNLDALYQPLSTNVPAEVYTVTRNIQFNFTPTDPTGAPTSDYGVTTIGGNYTETITGLHRNPLVVSGTFHLTHTFSESYLNVVQ